MPAQKPPRLIPPLGGPVTSEQATILQDLYGDDAGELTASVAVTLREKGRVVDVWEVLTADELVRSMNAVIDREAARGEALGRQTCAAESRY
jgi:hypothetical protein